MTDLRSFVILLRSIIWHFIKFNWLGSKIWILVSYLEISIMWKLITSLIFLKILYPRECSMDWEKWILYVAMLRGGWIKFPSPAALFFLYGTGIIVLQYNSFSVNQSWPCHKRFVMQSNFWQHNSAALFFFPVLAAQNELCHRSLSKRTITPFLN